MKKEATKGDALSVLSIMEQKGWNKDEVRELVAYLKSTQRPLKWHIYGVGVAVLAAVGVFPDQFLLVLVERLL